MGFGDYSPTGWERKRERGAGCALWCRDAAVSEPNRTRSPAGKGSGRGGKILVTVDVLLELSELSRKIVQPAPPHTDENDGDDAEDNDADALLVTIGTTTAIMLFCP